MSLGVVVVVDVAAAAAVDAVAAGDDLVLELVEPMRGAD